MCKTKKIRAAAFFILSKKLVNVYAMRKEDYISYQSKAKDRLSIELGMLRVSILSTFEKEEKCTATIEATKKTSLKSEI